MTELQSLFKNDFLWVVNKPAQQHFDEVMPLSVRKDWEAVHRLDYETSGALLYARSPYVAKLRRGFKDSELTRKIYFAGAGRALSDSHLTSKGWVKGFIGSRYRGSKKVSFAFESSKFRAWHSVQPVEHKVEKISHKVPSNFEGELYQVELKTGARHQIRAFFAALGAPLCGDPLYGKPGLRLSLHAKRLEFRMSAKDPWIRVEAPLI